jgi:hypothetical protein
MSFFRRMVWSIGSIFLISTSASAQSLLEFNFNGATGSQTTSVSTYNAPVVQPSTISRGPGVTAAPFADSFNATGWTNSATLDANDYFTFNYSSSSLSSLSNLTINVNRNGLGPRLIEVRDSLSGFGTAGVVQPLPNASLITPISFNLAGVTALQNIPANTIVELRIYAYDSNNATNSQFALDSTGNVPSLVLSGTPVPEPATVGGLAAMGLFGFGWLRRRLRK